MNSDTIAAIATAPGGAMGIIRISGPRAVEITDEIFNRSISEAKGYTVHYGHIVDLDDVLVTVFRAPHSYTGEDSTEISCHGSRFIMQKVMELLIQHGARQALPGEFTQRAFLNGKLDLCQAEAVADLIASSNAATHNMAMSQLRGGFSKQLKQLRDQLLQLTSLLELELDFTEQDVEFADRTQLCSISEEVDNHITRLVESFQMGNAIKGGIPVAIVGAPNVGKSTLLNALLQEDRAIVSDIQGTTRDLIEDVMQISGITFRFIDTAGIRKTEDTIEKMGIERSLQAAERAQIVILLCESEVEIPDIRLPEDKPVMRVINKADLRYPANSFVYNTHTPGSYYYISALTGAGMPLFLRELVKKASVPELTENDVVVSNVRHFEALSHALDDIRRVRQGLADGIPSDFVAMDLRQCIHHLSSILGEGAITSDEVLRSIFRNFCIGK